MKWYLLMFYQLTSVVRAIVSVAAKLYRRTRRDAQIFLAGLHVLKSVSKFCDADLLL